jgi:hypothetical protein
MIFVIFLRIRNLFPEHVLCLTAPKYLLKLDTTTRKDFCLHSSAVYALLSLMAMKKGQMDVISHHFIKTDMLILQFRELFSLYLLPNSAMDETGLY